MFLERLNANSVSLQKAKGRRLMAAEAEHARRPKIPRKRFRQRANRVGKR